MCQTVWWIWHLMVYIMVFQFTYISWWHGVPWKEGFKHRWFCFIVCLPTNPEKRWILAISFILSEVSTWNATKHSHETIHVSSEGFRLRRFSQFGSVDEHFHGGTEVQHRPQAVPPKQNPALFPALPKLSHPHPQRLRSSDGIPVEHEFARRKRFRMGRMGDHFRRHGHGNFSVYTSFNIYGTERS